MNDSSLPETVTPKPYHHQSQNESFYLAVVNEVAGLEYKYL